MISIALQISLIILAAHSFTWDGMIFDWVKKLIEPGTKIYGKDISKPLYGCPICMIPWWGSLIYFLIFQGFEVDGWIQSWFVTIGSACGFSVIYVLLIDIKEYAVSRTRDKKSCCVTDSISSESINDTYMANIEDFNNHLKDINSDVNNKINY